MKKILIADDSSAWRMFHKNNMEEVFIELDISDYKLDLAASGREGYNCILHNSDNPYDLIISDLQMEDDFAPKSAGEWFIEQIKTFDKYFNTKILIVSGSYNIKYIAEHLNTDYLPKRTVVSDINKYKDLVIKLLAK